MRRYRCFDIVWDFSDLGENETVPDLSDEMILTIEGVDNPDEVSDLLSDELSDDSGYLHDGFKWEEV